MILSAFVRVDGQGCAFALSPEGEDPQKYFARNMYTTPGEPYPGAVAVDAWRLKGSTKCPGSCRTVREALRACGWFNQ